MTVAFTRTGRGPTVLCLHGIGSGAASFAAQQSALAGDLDLIAWDAPGYAASGDPAEAPGLDGYVDAAARLIASEAPPAVHVLGVSWGGVIALRLAATRPDLVRSLTLVGSSLGSGTTAAGAEAMRRRAAVLEQVGAAAFAAERGPRLVSARAPASLVDGVVATMRSSIRLPGYGHAAAAMAAADLSADLPAITAPTLVMAGSEDTVTGPDRAREIADGIPGAALLTLPGAGHLANQERPDAFNAWLLGFIGICESLSTTSASTQPTRKALR